MSLTSIIRYSLRIMTCDDRPTNDADHNNIYAATHWLLWAYWSDTTPISRETEICVSFDIAWQTYRPTVCIGGVYSYCMWIIFPYIMVFCFVSIFILYFAYTD